MRFSVPTLIYPLKWLIIERYGWVVINYSFFYTYVVFQHINNILHNPKFVFFSQHTQSYTYVRCFYFLFHIYIRRFVCRESIIVISQKIYFVVFLQCEFSFENGPISLHLYFSVINIFLNLFWNQFKCFLNVLILLFFLSLTTYLFV